MNYFYATSRVFKTAAIGVIFLIIAAGNSAAAQGVGISETSITPDASAVLEVRSTARGLLPPRMTEAERNAIASPATGLTVFNSTTNRFNVYDGSSWIQLAAIPDNFIAQTTSIVSTTSTTLTNVTGLSSFSLTASSTYYFKFKCLVSTSATTVGVLLSTNASAAVSSINYVQMYPTSATAVTYQRVTVLQGGTLPTAGPGATFREYTLEGTVVTSGAVTFALQFRSETGGQVNVQPGSFGLFQKIL